ncbi:MAG: hypothetical protein Q9188_002499 [Gyalolechia gomerana]
MARKGYIEELFARNGYEIEQIDMSTHPYTGRNPSCCFVDLTSNSQADIAAQKLNDQDLLGLPVRLGPGVAASRRGPFSQGYRKAYPKPAVFQRRTRNDASYHSHGYSDQARRVWVADFPDLGEHNAFDGGVRELFAGFDMTRPRFAQIARRIAKKQQSSPTALALKQIATQVTLVTSK